MKHLLLLSLTVVLFSMSAFATDLLPSGHTMCLNPDAYTCEEGSQLAFDHSGRCACLFPDDYQEPDFCRRAFIKCDEDAGYTFETVYSYVTKNGRSHKKNLGCGCFKTIEFQIIPT